MRNKFSRSLMRRGRHNAAVAVLSLVAFLSLIGCFHHHCEVTPESVSVDPDGNSILEPGEVASVQPSWHYASALGGSCLPSNPCPPTAAISLDAAVFAGPAGGVYTIADAAASYLIPIGTTASCATTGNCYAVSVSARDGRPALHWHATLTEVEAVLPSAPLTWIAPMSASVLDSPASACPIPSVNPVHWSLHIGRSFSDVETSSIFYPFIEELLHNGVTGGCGDGTYCPGASVRRDQMSVFLLKAKHGAGFVPPACAGIFADVPCPGPFADWVERVVSEGIIEACTGDGFCPATTVTRRHMAVWLLKALMGSSYAPPPATGVFDDVTLLDPDVRWIEDLYTRGITAGCSAEPHLYCPDAVNTRAQMAVFLDKTFSLTF